MTASAMNSTQPKSPRPNRSPPPPGPPPLPAGGRPFFFDGRSGRCSDIALPSGALQERFHLSQRYYLSANNGYADAHHKVAVPAFSMPKGQPITIMTL